jgi:hypothetical protein
VSLGKYLDLQSLLLLFPGAVAFEIAETTLLDEGAIGNNMVNLLLF